ncbi:SAP domain-containing protein [Colletotrichum karsti]|uniref:SAP domain-containing protein n=1 Tax=Colletotrichum karsti TaxID=1095194 RepID=A0A9P6LQ78_9PEZI|nr:SAP domain-containing protein [Colletotrichum karsti]KAF9881865.1 SAP domain-containing protein [Colletotrichum karsti]
MKDWSKQTVVQLKAELKRRGLAVAGLKQELVTRLSEDDATAAVAENEAEPSEPEPAEDPEPQPVEHKEPTEPTEPLEPTDDPAPAPVDDAPKEVASTEAEPASTPAPAPTESEAPRSEPKPVDELAAPPDSNKQDAPAAVLMTEASTESAPPAPAEIAQDAQKRKRRSESPVQSAEEVSRKRVKADQDEAQSSEPSGVSGVIKKIKEGLENNTSIAEDIANDAKYISDHVAEPTSEPMDKDSQPQETKEDAEDVVMKTEDDTIEEEATEGSHGDASAQKASKHVDDTSRSEDQALVPQESFESVQQLPTKQDTGDAMEVERDVQPSLHPATRALYIKNFMRPLREEAVQAHLLELATPTGTDPDSDDIEVLFVDRIKTHAFAVFRTTAQASRVRNALHDVTWPDERNRKQLWVDFVPPENVTEWIDEEQNQDSGRGGTRWEVSYSREDDGFVVARLTSGTAPPPAVPAPEPARQIPSGPAVKDVNAISLGPRAGRGTDGAPLGPRGDPPRGPSGRGPRQIQDFPGGPLQTTNKSPQISYQPVTDDLANRRIRNMRSYYTQDLQRDMGPETDINRYTFEQGDGFVDRGKENFVGIRPPHRERGGQRRPDRGPGGRGPPPRGPPPGRGRRQNGNRRGPRLLSDRYLPGINDSGPYRQGDRGNFGSRGDDRDRRY